MTKKELSKEAGISVSRIGQLMPSMTENIDYVIEKRGDHGTRIVFTEIGISKVMNRNRLHYSEKSGRPKKNLQTIEKGGEV